MPAVVWIFIALAVICGCVGAGKDAGARKGGERDKAWRIDHPHYVTADECECSMCGFRFPGRTLTCPRCGVRFEAVRKDEREWEEEFDEECDMDEEEEL